MSKRKIISSLFLSATVLGGLLFTQTPTVKANEEGKVQIAHISPIFDPGELIQETNYNDLVKKSVSIEATPGSNKKEVRWKVIFDSTYWNFKYDKGGYYFVVPSGMKLKRITLVNGQTREELLDRFPKNINDSNSSNSSYRLFKRGENTYDDRDFDSQWGWSVGRASNDKINQWKNENAFSDIYYIDSPRHAGPVTYELEAEVTDQTKTSFPLVAVMKNFYARTSYFSEPTSLAGLDVQVEWPK
ncbi:TPA: translation initiation factor 2 [Streptococcus suis]|nr:translation initiation factor 2 [Streptococcus suis]